MTTTISCLPPDILTSYDPYILDRLLGLKMHIKNYVEPLFLKKNRAQDAGKRKEFNKLLREFEEIYERKKIEEKEYHEKIKNSAKRSCLPIAGPTCRFKRFQS